MMNALGWWHFCTGRGWCEVTLVERHLRTGRVFTYAFRACECAGLDAKA